MYGSSYYETEALYDSNDGHYNVSLCKQVDIFVVYFSFRGEAASNYSVGGGYILHPPVTEKIFSLTRTT